MIFIKLLSIIVIVVLGISILCILIKNKSKYSDYTRALSEKDFILKGLFPIGLYILDKYSYSFNSSYDRRMLNQICEIYGQEYAPFYARVIYANKIVLFMLLIITQLTILVLANLQTIIHFYALLLFVLLIMSDDFKLKKKVNRRRLEIQIEFPDFINKLTLLLNAGLTMSKAWEKISVDCEKTGDFYMEIRRTVSDIKSGKNEAEAFGEFAKRVKTPQISRLMSAIIQNTKKGGTELVLSLRLQSNECWEMRKNVIRRLGEEASTKLLFPMMIMFFAILIIVITPAIISMQGIK